MGLTEFFRLPAALLVCAALGACSGEDAPAAGGSSSSSAPSSSPSPSPEVTPSVRPGPDGAMKPTDGRRTRITATIKVGTEPCGVVVAFGSAWVTDAGDARLFRISLETNRVEADFPLDDAPCELTAAGDSLWVTTQSGRLDRFDPESGRVTARIRTGSTSYETIAAFGSVWVSNRGDGTLTQVDPATNRTRTRELGISTPGGLVAADGHLWVGQDAPEETTVLRIDPDTWETDEVETQGRRPAWLAATDGVVWVAQTSSATVSGIDTGALQPNGLPAAAGFSPVNLEASPDGHWVWVPDDGENFVTRIDARTGEAVERLLVESGPAVVAAGDDEVWVTNFGAGSVQRLTLGR